MWSGSYNNLNNYNTELSRAFGVDVISALTVSSDCITVVAGELKGGEY